MSEPGGFYYMRARYYDPNVGRFISEDPKGFDGGDVNLYAYVQNNPIMGIDPSGLDVMINITRTTYTENSIVSKIQVYSTTTGSSFSGYALENASPPNPNLPVPNGSYSAFVRSDHSPNRIELIGVPGASNVQIHTGNSPSDVIGCFAVGTSTSTNWVGNSRSAMNQINRVVSGDNSGRITVNVQRK
jgi:RHS repeat-associated protein